MKRFYTLSVSVALFAWFAGGDSNKAVAADTDNGIGLAIVYDTSGSMREPVKDTAGREAPKYEIANRAFLSIVDRVAAFHQAHADVPIKTGLVVFNQNGARWAVPFADFDPNALRSWIRGFSKPDGATPLGEAVSVAALPLMKGTFKHRHIVVVTDGQNTAGRDPAAVVTGLRAEAAKSNARLGIHFVAFDVEAKVFNPIKKLDVTVVSASGEKQLQEQLTFILEQKVLLEDEEGPRPVR